MMFTEKDRSLAIGIKLEAANYITEHNPVCNEDRTFYLNQFTFLYLAKLENENKELRSMITGEHEVMT